MAGFDYVILAILLLSAIVGLVRGFLREVVSLVSWILAIWLAWKLGPSLEPFMGGALRQANYGLWAGRTIVFVLVLVVGRLLGFLLGLARGVVVLGTLMLLGQTVKLDGEDWWKNSRLVPQVEPVAKALRTITGETLESLKKEG
jgi:membrane protein required for colicin V production